MKTPVHWYAMNLNHLQGTILFFLFNICTETPGKEGIYVMLKSRFPGCIIINTSNKGKDIGAKLALAGIAAQHGYSPGILVNAAR